MSLEKAVLREGLLEIGDRAFAGTDLFSAAVPDGVEVVGREAFEGCRRLDVVTVWGAPAIGDGAFAMCPSLETIYFVGLTDDAARSLPGYPWGAPAGCRVVGIDPADV